MGGFALSLLLDTHIWRRWRNEPKRLSVSHKRALTKAEQRNETLFVSAVSLWELATLAAAGRIGIHQELESWLREMADDPLIAVLPITPAIAAASVQLHGLPADPADRLIAATARCHQLTLMTADERIIAWGGVPLL